MRVDIRNKDFLAGLMLVAIGGVAGYIALGYPMGTVLRMGSGYFPTVLSGLLVAFGVALIIRAARTSEQVESNWSLRALLILPVSLALFGFLLDRAGFIPAMLAVIFGSALASSEFRLAEVLALAIGLTAVSVVVFVWALGLPYELYKLP